MSKRPPLHFTPLYPEHVQLLKIHPVQTDEWKAMLNNATLSGLHGCVGVTAWAGDHPIGLAGVWQHWPGRGEAWVLVSKEMGYYYLQVYEKVRFVLDTFPLDRIEMTVKVHNADGHKLARQLGFGGPLKITLPNGKTVEAEGLLRKWWPTPSGAQDVVMYSRIKTP